MSNFEQCAFCKKFKSGECPKYEREGSTECADFVKPINNEFMFSHIFSFKGRAGIPEFIITLGVIGLASYLSSLCQYWLVFIPILLYLYMDVCVRRFHDFSCPGYMALLCLLILPALFMIVEPSDQETNEYGTVPGKSYDKYNEPDESSFRWRWRHGKL